MKKGWFCVLLCLLLPALAAAQPLDFSHVTEKEHWLTGEINTGRPLNDDPNSDTTVYVDCAAPQPFTAEQWVRLTTELWQIDKKSFAAALEAVGVDTRRGKLTRNMSSPVHRGISYQQERDTDAFGCSNAKTWTKEMQAAVDASERLFDSLGFQISIESVMDYGERSWNAYGYTTDGAPFQNNEEAYLSQLLEKEAKHGRKPSDYLWLSGVPTLRGLPVGSMSYPVGGSGEPDARCGIACYAGVFADKSGRLLNVYLEGIPLEKSTEPLTGEPMAWQAAFERLNEYGMSDGCSWFNARKTDEPDGSGATLYATRNVLTAITPAWIGVRQNELTPGFCFTVEMRRRMDDACLFSWSGWVDGVEGIAGQ